MKISSRLLLAVFTIAIGTAAPPGQAQTSDDGQVVYCCDPAQEPGLPGNQFCAEGFTCCASGDWSCNDASGALTCNACEMACCDPLEEPGQFGNSPCVEGATCCGNGQWQCNDSSGSSTCAFPGDPCPQQCCSPLSEPGAFGNPPCVEGANCCSTGQWQCNDATGASSCLLDGFVCEACCEPLAEPGLDGTPPCVEGATCCSTGEWQCNSGNGSSTCVVDGVVCEPRCCDPAERPNEPGNAYCAGGFTCCADGTWRCNDSTGLSVCPSLGDECPEVCGGIAGIMCQDPDDFCKLPTGECCCDAQGVCTPQPEACPEFFDPVCGCDGVTYDNECFADAAGVSVAHAGACGQVCGGIAGIPCNEGEFCLLRPGECCCDFEGVCVPIPDACPAHCEPVCGCDGKTYKNACLALMASVSVDHFGPCFEGGGLITGVEFESRMKLSWLPHPEALFYNVYRTIVEESPPLSAGVCFKTELVEPSVPVVGVPGHGVLWLFQVAGQFEGGEGPLGINWLCDARIPAVPCAPSEQVLCESTGGIWDPLSCGHYPCGQFPSCDAIIPGCNCGPDSNFAPEIGCTPDPTCAS